MKNTRISINLRTMVTIRARRHTKQPLLLVSALAADY